MKINVANEIAKTLLPSDAGKNEKTQNGEFDRILKNALGTTQNVAETTAPHFADPLSEISADSVFQPNKATAIEEATKLLDLLDAYRVKLADPAVTLRDITPLVEEMEIEQKGLTSLFHALPEDDELKDILNQALIDLSMETVRFNRGDYS